MASDNKDFSLLSYNMHGFYEGHPIIDDLINSSNTNALLLQEH